MARNLTDRFCETVKPDKEKRLHIFDSQVPGLCLRISSKGKKTFTIVARGPNKKQIWREVGQQGVMSLADARELAREGIRRAKNGLEPFPKPDPDDGPRTYLTVRDDFIEKYAKPKQRTWKETERILKSVGWDKRVFAEITKSDAYDLLDGFIAEGKTAKARVTLAWLKTLWRWAWKRDYVATPLMDAVEIELERKVRTRIYDDEEIKALWEAQEGLATQERAFIKLLTLLGVRKNELAKMRREEIDNPDKPTLWTVPHGRTKSKKSTARERVYLVPLPPLAQRILKPLLKGEDDLVFPGRHDGKAFDPGTPFMRKIRVASGIEDWYPHAHRDTVSTWMQNQGATEYERGLILNHAGSGSVTGDYSHGYPLDLKRKWFKRWADHVGKVVASEDVELLA
ncbi:MAG: integrase family protein [Alphaproteobacteria bacterium]|nr:integrase family protein [Alphaproteobacteria bacterium]